MAIPASDLVQITPRVLAGTGQGLNFNGLFLSENANLPTNQLMPFYSANEVANFFGAGSTEYSLAQKYFSGFDNSQTKPSLLYFFKHQTSDAPAFARSGAFDQTQAQMLANIATISGGTFTATINGHTETINNLNFSGITSLSAAAAILQAGIRSVDIPDVAASNEYATAIVAGEAGNNLSITINQGTPKETSPAVRASCPIATAQQAGLAGNSLSIDMQAGTPIVDPAVKATSEIGEAVTAGAQGNSITVEVVSESETVTPAQAATCKYGTAKTAGASGNNLKVVITANGTTPENFDVKINDGSSDVFTQENVASGSNTSALNSNEYIEWAASEALAVEEVQLTGGADAVEKDVYTVTTKLAGEIKDTQSDLDAPSALTDNELVAFNKSLESFAETTYTFTGGKDEESTPTFNVVTLNNGEAVNTQNGVLEAQNLEDNAYVRFNQDATLEVSTYQLSGGAEAVYVPTFDVLTLQNGNVQDQQTGLESAQELTNNTLVTFDREATLTPGVYPLTGGRDMGGEAWSQATVSYASNLNAFTVTTGTAGEGVSIANCSGNVAEAFYLTEAQGATYSEGAAPSSYTETMNAVIEAGQNWFSFSTVGHLTSAEAIELAQWSSSMYTQGTQFLFVFWDDDAAMLQTTTQGNTTAAQLNELNVTGTTCIYDAPEYAAFLMGAIASINFDGNNSTVTLAFKSQSGLGANVQTETAASALEAIRVNFIGNYASRNDNFVLLQHGEMFGEWHWIDSYVNSTWLSSELQVQILAGLQAARRVPYTVAGYTLIRSWCQSVIERAITNGVISAGVNLSQAQKTEIQQEAGLDISSDLYNNGFYLQILDADATVRQARQSPTLALWYTDAGSVHRISMPVTTVQ